MTRFFVSLLLLIYYGAHCQGLDAYLQSPVSDRKKADSLLTLAKKYHVRFKMDSALLLFGKGITYALKTDDNRLKASYYIEMSRSYRLKGNPAEALRTVQKAYPFLNPDEPSLANALYHLRMGQYHTDLNQYDSALRHYDVAESHYNKVEPYENWVVYEGIATVFIQTQSRKKAEEYLLKGYALTKGRKKRADHGTILFILANFYVTTGQTDKFAGILNEYNAFMAEGGNQLNRDPIHSMLFLNWQSFSIPERIAFLEKVKATNLQDGYLEGAAASNYHIALIYEEEKDFAKALEYLMESEKKYIRPDNYSLMFINQQHRLRIQKKAGRTDEVIQTLEKLLALSAKLSDAQSKEIALKLEKQYETEKKQQEIALLKSQHEISRLQLKSETEKGEALQRENKLKEDKLAKELQLRRALEREKILSDSSLAKELRLNEALEREGLLQESELKKEKMLTAALSRENALKQLSLTAGRENKKILWAGISVLALSIGIILWQFSRQLKKNRIIREQAEEMEVLNREIHHRVKNNLQVISSLLDLQSQTLRDTEAAEVIRESRQRVQSMAFIHQNLYQSNTVQEVEITNYIQHLADHLFRSYNIRKDKIKFTTDIDKISLHSDTVIPLGMILNELISNSLKYAFRDLQEGEIRVTMKQQEKELLLQVKDNGRGLPAGFDISQLQSFGFKVIRAFAQKLKARLHIDGSHGTNVELVIAKFKTI